MLSESGNNEVLALRGQSNDPNTPSSVLSTRLTKPFRKVDPQQYVDGKQVATWRIEHTVRARFSLEEDFGEDTGTPVIEDYAAKMPYRFNGILDKFTIHLEPSQLSASDEQELGAAFRKAAGVRQ